MRVEWDVLQDTMTDSISYRVKLFPVFSGSNLPPDSAAITSFVTTRQYAVFRGLTLPIHFRNRKRHYEHHTGMDFGC